MTAAVAPARDDTVAAAAAHHRRAIPWSVVVLAVPTVIGVARLVLSIRHPYDHWGDHAIFETAIRRVASGTQAVGPYSRFGFHQPGPAYFEAQAPFYWLSGASPRALFIGALSLNLGSALGCVLVIRRFVGEPTARWAAVLLVAFLLALTPALRSRPLAGLRPRPADAAHLAAGGRGHEVHRGGRRRRSWARRTSCRHTWPPPPPWWPSSPQP